MKRANEHMLLHNLEASYCNSLHAPSAAGREGARKQHENIRAELKARGYPIPPLTEGGRFANRATKYEALIRCLQRGDARPREGMTVEGGIARLRADIPRLNEYGGIDP